MPNYLIVSSDNDADLACWQVSLRVSHRTVQIDIEVPQESLPTFKSVVVVVGLPNVLK